MLELGLSIWTESRFEAQLITIIIAALTIYYFSRPLDRASYSHACNTVISLGIFGTFLGVLIGLFHFDSTNIEKSVPGLIGGLSTAFSTSVAGLFAALVLRGKQTYETHRARTSAAIAGGATIDDLALAMKEIKDALVGNQEATLLTQFQKMRTENNDRLDQLNETTKNYMEKMAEYNSKALIDALNEVIRDFNTKINEQFGENFKQLNVAVGRILEWQQKYREQMHEMITQQDKTAESMASAVSHYETVVAEAEKFSKIASDLKTIIDALESQRGNLARGLEAFSKMASDAEAAMPKIEQRLAELTTGLANAVDRNTKHVSEFVEKAAKNTERQVEVLDKALSEELTKALESFGRQMAALSEKFVSDYLPLTEKLRQVVQIAAAIK